MYSDISDPTFVKPGSPIRTSLDQRLFPTPQSFSQDSTSFIASYCQGIHRLRFSSWPYNLNHFKSYLLKLRLCYLFVYLIFNELWLYQSKILLKYFKLTHPTNSALVEPGRIELPTPCVQGRCSPSWATTPFFASVFCFTLRCLD